MPSHLISAKIRGIRSYSPRDDKTQAIDFMPLTLIVGKNGTGKTTIIEALKFIIAGEEPPNSDSRRNFIHAPRDDKKKILMPNDHSYACVEIEFKNGLGETCLARREITQAGSTGKNSTPAISSGYKINQNSWITVHRQDDWSRVLPKLFGLPNQAILSHVILCHQEDNLWCMGDSAYVKQIFDKIFGCEQYKKEIKHIEDEIRACKRDVQLSEKDMHHHAELIKRKKLISHEIEKFESNLKQSEIKAKGLDARINELVDDKKDLSEKLKECEVKSRQIASLKQRVKELNERDNVLRRSLEPLLNRSKLMPERRPPPPPPLTKVKKMRKKPEQDPTAVELELVMSKISDMAKIIDRLPNSEDARCLKELILEINCKINKIKQRFTIRFEEEKEDDDEPEEDLHRKWYEEQEAAARANEARRIEEDNKFRASIELNVEANLKELEETKNKLEELQNNASKFLTSAEESQQELRDIDQQLLNLRDNRSMIAGSSMQMEREMIKLQAELKSYWRASINYSESLGRMVCNKTIQSDLEKLKLCFNESITLFHDQMLVKINEALCSRWRQIYQGGDIHTIEVVAEETTRGKDKKSFNYYMAMRKGTTRMKMREKSSAGQRALASIILRMTLAELFVRDFTFIALDEPTANLDLTNVQALAKSIGSYVRRRTKKGACIQWIIITHDEEFLRALDEESSPFFYRIKLNADGYSEITKVSSSETNLENQHDSQDSGPWKSQ